ncbi:hypothetical protein DB30_06152 [Enhygromyxa salina]|uniref:DUF2914 domain-containing protein n=1 Tax=Enhygromyxa salina TaxID=215803 RepID=A0A0C1ZV74_9BACT|nr:DUF2914 domain-containing protein [Enhygromyxa salina]KIG14963.1 hypothetical protein DB30_06152 [Enhygromyxa salina]
MSRIPIVLVSCLLLSTLACGAPADPGANEQVANKTPAPATAAEPKPAEPAPVTPARSAEPAAVAPAEEPPTEEPPAEANVEAPSEPASGSPTDWKPPPGADIRSDAVIAPGTPPENAAAFKSLPNAKGDGPPVSAIGANGIHFDSLVVGRGFEKSRCVEPTDTFDVEIDDRANICLRIVHPAGAEETLTVTWAKTGGHGSRTSKVTVKDAHAYLTRSYLPLKKTGYQGEWTATITTEDGTELASVSFTVK